MSARERGRPAVLSTGEVVRAFADLADAQGYAPSVRELVAVLGVKSTQTVAHHLVHAEELGFITAPPAPGMSRARLLTEDGRAFIERQARRAMSGAAS